MLVVVAPVGRGNLAVATCILHRPMPLPMSIDLGIGLIRSTTLSDLTCPQDCETHVPSLYASFLPGEGGVSILFILILARIIHVCPCMFPLPSLPAKPKGTFSLYFCDSLHATQTPVNGLDIVFSLSSCFPLIHKHHDPCSPLSGSLRPSPTFCPLIFVDDEEGRQP